MGHPQGDCGQSIVAKKKQIWRPKPDQQTAKSASQTAAHLLAHFSSLNPTNKAPDPPFPLVKTPANPPLPPPVVLLDLSTVVSETITTVPVSPIVVPELATVTFDLDAGVPALSSLAPTPTIVVPKLPHVPLPMDPPSQQNDSHPLAFFPDHAFEMAHIQPLSPKPTVSTSTLQPDVLPTTATSSATNSASLDSSSLNLVKIEVVTAASSDSEPDAEGHHSDPSTHTTGRRRKPYTKRNYGQSSMVTRSSVPPTPNHD